MTIVSAHCLAALFVSCIATAHLATPAARVLPQATFSLNNSLIEFAEKLAAAESLSQVSGNQVFSPFSIASLLNLMLLGATGNTYDQLRYVLAYPFQVEDLLVHQLAAVQLRQLQHQLQLSEQPAGERLQSEASVHVASRVFSDAGFKVEPEFVRRADHYYMTLVEQVEFGRDPVQTTRNINNWISAATNNMIPQLLKSPLPRTTRLVAVNAVLFNGTWKNQFSPANTKQMQFHVSSQLTSKTAIMFAQMTVPFAEFADAGFRAVLLPYKGDRFDMLLLLPDLSGVEHVQRLERTLSPSSLANILAQLQSSDIQIWLPKFHLEQHVSLRDTLQQLGATDVFQESRAALESLSADRGLFLNEILHQAVIKVDERGTEAAAVTATVVNRDRFSRSFRANRPFLFILRDSRTGTPLFWGRLVNPSS